jgi:hypothetical protein
MPYIPIRLRRGRLVHLVTEGSDSPRETLCGKNSDASIVSDLEVSCARCCHVRLHRTQASK